MEWLQAAVALVAVAVATATDLRERRIPNGLTAAVALVGGVWSLVTGALGAHIAAAALTGGVLLGVRGLGHVLAGRPGLGMGDVKLGAALALLVGADVLWVFYLAAVVGAVVGLAGRLSGRLARHQAVPFAPFILCGMLLAYLVPFDLVWARLVAP